ncbi:MAG: TolC family protein [Bacteroidales bacterium]|nr:TolC family protein [Bacteroidales bacterium]
MKNFGHHTSLLVMAIFLACTAFSQEKWTLEKCISHAREHNLQVRRQAIAVEQAGNNLTSARLEYLPTMNASMNHNMSWGRSVNLNDLEIIENKLSQSTSLNFSASVPLFEGMRKQNNIKSSKVQLELAGSNVEKLKDEISIQIVQAFLQVMLCREMEKSALESCNSVEAQVERTRALVDAGSQPYSSLLEVQAQLASEKVQVVAARNNLRTNMINLAQLLDIDNIESFDIEAPEAGGTIPDPENYDEEEIFAGALGLPAIRSAELALENSELQYRIQKGAALPTISFSAGYGTYYSDNQPTPFFTQFDNNRNPSMGFGLSIPIFNSWKNNAAIRNARLNVKSSEIDLRIQRQNLRKEIQQACNEALSGYEKMNAARENLISARESAGYTKEKFNLGILNGTDYTVAMANLYKAESEYLQNKYQYIFQLKILDYYRNIPLTL